MPLRFVRVIPTFSLETFLKGSARSPCHCRPRCVNPIASSRDGSGRKDPFCGLTGHLCYQIEVVVVMEDDQSGGLSCCRDEKISDLCPALLAPVGERVLHG